MDQLSKESEIILNEIKGKTSKEKTGEVGAYINEFYGTVQKEDLVRWLDTRFGIK
jgi:hypothetical protein